MRREFSAENSRICGNQFQAFCYFDDKLIRTPSCAIELKHIFNLIVHLSIHLVERFQQFINCYLIEIIHGSICVRLCVCTIHKIHSSWLSNATVFETREIYKWKLICFYCDHFISNVAFEGNSFFFKKNWFLQLRMNKLFVFSRNCSSKAKHRRQLIHCVSFVANGMAKFWAKKKETRNQKSVEKFVRK